MLECRGDRPTCGALVKPMARITSAHLGIPITDQLEGIKKKATKIIKDPGLFLVL